MKPLSRLQAAAGIGASLRDWMHCADANLDLDPVTLTGRASDMAIRLGWRAMLVWQNPKHVIYVGQPFFTVLPRRV